MNASQQSGPVFWSSEALARMSEQMVSTSPTRPQDDASTSLQNATAALNVATLTDTLASNAAARTPMPNLATTSPPPMSIPPAPAVVAPAALPLSMPPVISFADGRFVYEPYPIVSLRQAIGPAVCDEMLAAWPPQHFFSYRRELGSRFSLSSDVNSTNCEWYIENTPLWRDLHYYVVSPVFIDNVLGTLAAGGIDTGYRSEQITSRFEFAMIGGDGGHAMPHTDPPGRVVTIEMFVAAADEWDPEWGGGVAMLKPTDIAKNYNVTNRPARFEEMTCLETFSYLPGGGVLIVKTFNSHRAIYPMTGPPQSLRRSLVITLDEV